MKDKYEIAIELPPGGVLTFIAYAIMYNFKTAVIACSVVSLFLTVWKYTVVKKDR